MKFLRRFFVNNGNFLNGKIVITGEDCVHIQKVLRMAVGDSLVLCTNDKTENYCTIAEITQTEIVCTPYDTKKSENEPTLKATLFQCLPKGDKMDSIIQKGVELGVSAIIPVSSENTVVKLDEKSASKKVERWNRIAKESAKQCGRGIVPTVLMPITFIKAIEQIKTHKKFVVFYEQDRETRINDFLVQDDDDFAFMIGSEGGFSKNEIAFAKENGVSSASLGNRILRTETASGCVLSIAMNITHNI